MQLRGHGLVSCRRSVVSLSKAVWAYGNPPTGATTSCEGNDQPERRGFEDGRTRPDAAHHGGSIREGSTPTSTLCSTLGNSSGSSGAEDYPDLYPPGAHSATPRQHRLIV